MKRYSLDRVQITEPRWVGKFDLNAAFLDEMDVERVLAGFRRNAGISTDAEPYGGWESGLIAGHGVGHYFSALAMRIVYLRGQAVAAGEAMRIADCMELRKSFEFSRAQAGRIIAGLSECQAKYGSGFLCAASEQDPENRELQFDILEGKAQGEQWVPWYALHKVLQGLIDLWEIAEIDGAKEVCLALGEWTCNRVLAWDEETRKKVLNVEFGGMNDCLYQLYGLTGDEKYRRAAAAFDQPELYADLLGFRNRLKGVHANTTMPKIIGYLRGAVAGASGASDEVGEGTADSSVKTGGTASAKPADEENDRGARISVAERFFDIISTKQSYMTGGVGDMEHFFGDGILDGSRTQCNGESCCAHNMIKLSQMLFELTGKIKYAEYIERTLWNAKLGSVGPDGGYTYFNPMATGYYKLYSPAHPAENPFWCCVGTAIEDFTKFEDQVYYQDGETVVITQWISSDIKVSENCRLSLQVDLEGGKLILQHHDKTYSEDKIPDCSDGKVHSPCEEETHVKLRVPRWIKDRAKYIADDQDYLELILDAVSRIEMIFEMELDSHVLPDSIPTPDAKTLSDDSAPKAPFFPTSAPRVPAIGFSYGPLVLCVPLGDEKWGITEEAGIDVVAPAWKVVFDASVKTDIHYGRTTKCVLDREFLTLPEGASVEDLQADLTKYVVRKDGGFVLTGLKNWKDEAVELPLIPYYQTGNERYGIYWYLKECSRNRREPMRG